ncbi:tyrosine-type recombinase/integrase [soil metagenome]
MTPHDPAPHDLAPFVTAFFVRHLPAERNASPHTTAAYRDTLKLLLRFAADDVPRPVAALHVEDLTPALILRFLTHLEVTRHNSIRTRNARLAAVHSFFRYVIDTEPALASLCQRVLTIPVKKAPWPVLGYLREDELAHLLAQIDRDTAAGERDYVMLALLYDTGARIQELLDLTPADFRLAAPPFVRMRGKGQRERLCPLLPQTARLVTRFLSTTARGAEDVTPLLQNRHGEILTRHGARYLLRKYLRPACMSMPTLRRARISPHTFRHTKAMHLLQAGIPLVTIKDILGHADVRSTEIYVQIDLEMKREALARTGTLTTTMAKRSRLPKDLIAWLEAL